MPNRQTYPNDNLRITAFNIHGLCSKGKIKNKALLQYLLDSFIFILSETHIEDQHMLEVIPEIEANFQTYYVPATRENRNGRGIGGFIFGVSNRLAANGIMHELRIINGVQVIELTIRGQMLPSIIILPIYIRNENWRRNFVEQVVRLFPRQNVIIIGDANIRIGRLQQRANVQQFVGQPLQAQRISQDRTTNSNGRRFLNFCNTCNLTVLNGRCRGDLQGAFTYERTRGRSVNDICAISETLIRCVNSFCVGENNFDSDHFPINLNLNMSKIIEFLRQPVNRILERQSLYDNRRVQAFVKMIKKSLKGGKKVFCLFFKFLNSAQIPKEIIDFIIAVNGREFLQSLQGEFFLFAHSAGELQEYITRLYALNRANNCQLDLDNSFIIIFRNFRGGRNNATFHFPNNQEIRTLGQHVFDGYVLTPTLCSLMCNGVNLMTLLTELLENSESSSDNSCDSRSDSWGDNDSDSSNEDNQFVSTTAGSYVPKRPSYSAYSEASLKPEPEDLLRAAGIVLAVGAAVGVAVLAGPVIFAAPVALAEVGGVGGVVAAKGAVVAKSVVTATVAVGAAVVTALSFLFK